MYQSRLCLQYDSDFENEYDTSDEYDDDGNDYDDDHEDSDDEYDDISNLCNDMMTIMRRAYYIYHITFSCSEESGSDPNHAYVIMMMKIVIMV